MLYSIAYFNSAIIIGIILFQSSLIAPSINRIINQKEASIFLRYIWPKFFLIIALLSLISFFCVFFSEINNGIIYVCLVISIITMFFCYILTPFINKAKDLSNIKLWKNLHMITIILTLLNVVLNFVVIIQY